MALMGCDGVIHWSPKSMEILEAFMTLGQVKVWARTNLALASKTITVTCILDCVRLVCLRAWVIDVTHHCDVGLGDDILSATPWACLSVVGEISIRYPREWQYSLKSSD